MSKHIGIDIVEFEEIKERLTDRFVDRILSEQELNKYHQIKNTGRKISYLAGRFAAKEAYTKVYKKFDEPLNFKDVIILNDEFGAPYIVSKYRPEDHVSVSISHSRNYAVAICIKE
ncbi:Holo-[acyl-carrier-protein] synthase [Candidatus Izimaplasma bacterium HR1]|jgi:holo-[acyl-carrier protein] synthase|uniref:holo-ACP synthase n=1 Tax=Candidatus Izimoplasma sp. HR1 TaxID=1541959 RepID=UPI0004F90B0D|nr:Holo-[acyl-carrier-protein] synthase [Candidatus Izimaplasma bacterium HR1]